MPSNYNPGFLLVFCGSGMLESGVDRIITQVVDPKMNHTFRPQIETAIHDFLSGDRKEENSLGCVPGPPEPTETQEPPSASGPKTPWGFAFEPDVQLKATGNLEILRSVFSCCRNKFLAVYTVLQTFSMAQRDVPRTNGKRRTRSCCTTTGKLLSGELTEREFGERSAVIPRFCCC